MPKSMSRKAYGKGTSALMKKAKAKGYGINTAAEIKRLKKKLKKK